MKKILGLCLVVGLGLSGCGDNKPQYTENNKENKNLESSIGEWEVVINRDKMRNTESKWLALRSENNADLNFPYDGENRLQIDILDSKTDNPRIFLTIDKGQYDCKEYGCLAAVKFGNAPIQYLTFREYDVSGSDGTVLVFNQNSKAFLDNIRKFKSIIIELPFYSNGSRQFTFNTSKFNEAEKSL